MAKEGEKPEERTRGLAALCAITETISGSLDLDETLNKALEKVMEFLGVEVGAIFLLDDQKRQAKLMVQRGLSEESVQLLNTLRVNERVIKALTKEGKRGKWVVIIEEALKRTKLLRDVKDVIAREKAHSYLPILVRFREDILGGMVVASRKAREFTTEEIGLSIAVGRQIGVTIENARLYQEQRRQLEERKRAEERALDAAKEWSTTFDSMADGVEILSADFEILNVNAALCKMLGKTKEELIGEKCYRVFHGKDAPISDCLLKKVKKSKQKQSIEMFEPTLNAWLSIAASPIFNEEGKVIRVVHLVTDITERKRAEEALRESQENFKALAENAIYGILIVVGEGRHVYANKRAAEITGYSVDELLKTTIKDLAHPHEFEKVMERYQKRLKGKPAPRQYETVVTRKDGKSVPIELAANKTVWQGQPADMVTFSDITERKRAGEALKASEEGYRTLFEGVPVGLYRATPDGQNLDANPAAIEMLGYPDLESLQAVDLADLYVNPDERAHWQALMEQEGVVLDFEAKLRRRDGTIIWVRDNARVVRDADGRVLYYEGSLEDITERKRAEEAQQLLSQQLGTLLEIAAGLETTASPTELATLLVRALADRLGYPFVGIWLREGDVLKLVAEVGYTEPVRSEFGDIPLEQGVIGRVARTLQPAFVPDVSQDSDFHGLADIRSEICCPLRGTGGLMGVLDVESCETLTEADFALVQAAARLSATALSNAQLFGASRRKAEELAALYDVSLDVATQLEIEQLLQTILERAIRLLDAKAGGIYLYDPAKREVELQVSYGLSRDYTGTRLALGEGLSGKVAQTGEPLIVDDYQKWEGRSPLWEGEAIGGVLGVPLKRGDDLLGVLTIDHAPGKTFQEGDGRLATLFANQAAIAIENARLYEQTDEKLQHRVAELTALNVIAQSLTSTLELDGILESIVTRVAQVMQARICTIRLVKGNELTVGAAVGYRDEASRQHTIKIDKHLARIVRDQQPLVVEDLWVAEDIPPSRRMRAWREEVHSFLGVPMISKRKTIGVLSIYREKPHRFTEEKINLLLTIANQAAIAIEDARLYEKVREHAEELERLVQERTKELQAIHAELLQSAKLAALGQLAAGVAHELNNPLGAISGYLELLQEEMELGPQEMDYMERIEKRIQQSTKIVAELRSLGTPSEPVWQIVNVNDILEGTLSLVERRLSFHQIKVQKDITPGLPLMHADPDRLEQVFINLITNARQAMEEGGTLRVASRESRNGEWVEIIFADTGEGIAKEHLNKMFEPFFTTKSPGKGMGLGLSLSHRHIKDHGGAIDVWSEKGRGTVFRVALPPSGAKRCWEIIDCDKKERCKAVRENAAYRCWSVMEDVSRCKGCEVYRKKALPPLDGTLLPQ